ncbi:ATP-binding protein [Streptomyces sp. NPDC059835]|uniref:ATP-binding protein n=1 Tax=Streptomyces sp. NPDC059835 TaxID=3346967 RepID=UPI00364644A9
MAHVTAGPEHLQRLRGLTSEVLLTVGTDTDAAETAQLVLSELVGNAVRACGDAALLVVEVYADDAGVAVHVHDPLPDLLPRPDAVNLDNAEAESGRGLPLLALLCSEVSIETSPIGKQVICRIAAR